jgi:flagella basal body P-ring formation protein FlgA
MRAPWMCVALVAAVTAARTELADATTVVRVRSPHDIQALKDGLLDLAAERLLSAGFFVDREGAWINVSRALPETDTFEVSAPWLADSQTPPLPLTFELRPVLRAGASAVGSIQATIAVTLRRDVLVANRRLRKGSAVSCRDFRVERRDLRASPRRARPMPCEIEPDAAALRELSPGDAVRTDDIGHAPDVLAGTPVRVSVIENGISISTSAVALADAQVGDRLDVRLQHPARTLKTRVTAPGAAQLVDLAHE